jgi:hypothetical protein
LRSKHIYKQQLITCACAGAGAITCACHCLLNHATKGDDERTAHPRGYPVKPTTPQGPDQVKVLLLDDERNQDTFTRVSP